MKKILAILIVLCISTVAWADVFVSVDSAGWTQDQKNMTQAMVEKILSDNGISHTNIIVTLPIIQVLGTSVAINVLTRANIDAEYAAFKTINDAANASAQQEDQARVAELSVSEFSDVKLSQINTRIDAISNLADMKIFLKKFARYVVSKR